MILLFLGLTARLVTYPVEDEACKVCHLPKIIWQVPLQNISAESIDTICRLGNVDVFSVDDVQPSSTQYLHED